MNENEIKNKIANELAIKIVAMKAIKESLDKTTSDPAFIQNIMLQLKTQANAAKVSIMHKTILVGLASKDITAWDMFMRMSNLIYGGGMNELETKSVLLKFVKDEIERRVGPIKNPSSPETTKESFPA